MEQKILHKVEKINFFRVLERDFIYKMLVVEAFITIKVFLHRKYCAFKEITFT